MSYTTTLYAVDLDRLRAAIGSKDNVLLDRVKRELLDDESDDRIRGKLIRVEVDETGTVYLDGKEVEIEQVKQAVQSLTGTRDRVRMPAPDSRARPDVSSVIIQTMNDMAASAGRTPSFESCPKEHLWLDEDDDGYDDDGSPSEDYTGVRRLIFGESAGLDTASDDAYALQDLCRVLGTELDTDDALGDLDPLQIDSPLCRWRMPVHLPQPEDFPFVSYLTPEEVAAEVMRLESMNLSFRDDEDIEYARKVLLECLKEANKKNQAVVAFYY
jgi:hypothetical protein